MIFFQRKIIYLAATNRKIMLPMQKMMVKSLELWMKMTWMIKREMAMTAMMRQDLAARQIMRTVVQAGEVSQIFNM